MTPVSWLRGTLRLDAARSLPPLAVLMEALWAYPWFVWIGDWHVLNWPAPPLTLASAVLLPATAMLMSRAALARNWAPARTLSVVLPVLLLQLGLIVRLNLGGGHALWDFGWWGYAVEQRAIIAGALAFGVYLLWRGISIGMETPSFEAIYRRFLFGLTALVLLLAFMAMIPGADEPRRSLESTGFYVIGFLSIGLLSMGLVNLKTIWDEMLRRDEASSAVSRRWFSMLLGVVFAVIAVSLVVAGAFSFNLATALLHPLRVLGDWLLTVFIYVVAFPLGVIASVLIYVFRFLASLLPRGEPPQPLSIQGPAEMQRVVEGQGTHSFPPEAALVLKWGLVALLVALVVFILARTLIRYSRGRRRDEEIEEVSESLWSWDGFKTDLRSFLSRLLGRFKRKRPVVPAAASPPLSIARETDTGAVFTVRDIYRGLLWEARRSGVPRHQSETPSEYKGRLETSIESEDEAIQAITEAYIEERYGRMDASGERLSALNRSWRSLRSALRGQGP